MTPKADIVTLASRKRGAAPKGTRSGGSSNTPPKCHQTKEGLDGPTVMMRIDWLQGTVRLGSSEAWTLIIDWLCRIGDDEMLQDMDGPRWTGRTWQHSSQSMRGLQIRWNQPDDGSDAVDGWLSMPGSWLAGLSVWDQLLVVQYLVRGAGFKATRLDVALDDFRRRITPREVMSEALDGHLCRYTTVDWVTNNKRASRNSRKWEGSGTVYLGKRGGDSFVRVYDKGVESRGEIDAIRWEVQLGRERAAGLARELATAEVDTDTELAQFLGGMVLTHSEFREFKEGVRSARRPFRAWYQSLVDDVGAFARLHVKRREMTVSRAVRWLRRTVAPTLAALGAIGGAEWLTHMLASGVEEALGRAPRKLEARRRLWGREGIDEATAALEGKLPRRRTAVAEPKLRRIIDDMTLRASPVLNWALGRESAAGTGPARPLEPVWVGWTG